MTNAIGRNARRGQKRVITREKLAALKFEPWPLGADEWRPPSGDEWTEEARRILPCVRVAWLMVHKTKAELETIVKGSRVETLDETLEMFERAQEFFAGFTMVLQAAEIRFMSAVESAIGVRAGA